MDGTHARIHAQEDTCRRTQTAHTLHPKPYKSTPSLLNPKPKCLNPNKARVLYQSTVSPPLVHS
jgi:hypothetical protein